MLLNGVLKNATAPYGKVLDVNHITQSASFPLEEFKTTIAKGSLHPGQVSDEPLAHEDDLDLQQQHEEDGQQDPAVHLITA